MISNLENDFESRIEDVIEEVHHPFLTERNELNFHKKDGKVDEFLKSKIFSPLFLFWTQQSNFVKYNIRQISKRKLGYCLGMLSCVLVVLTVCCTVSVSGQLPIIFLRIGENNDGQYDFSLTSSNIEGTMLNYTAFDLSLQNGALENYEKYSLSSPRTDFHVVLYNYEHCSEVDGKKLEIWQNKSSSSPEDSTQWFYDDNPFGSNVCDAVSDCLGTLCPTSYGLEIILFDTEKEKKMGLGRKWDYEPLQAGEIILSYQAALQIGVNVGDQLIVEFDNIWRNFDRLGGLFESIGIIKNTTTNYRDVDWRMFVPMVVKGIERDMKGKYSMTWYESREIGLCEYRPTIQHIIQYLNKDEVEEEQKAALSSLNPFEYSRMIMMNLPNRVDVYNDANYFNIQNDVTAFAGEVGYLAGINQFVSEFYLLSTIENSSMIALFLNLIINIIVTILVGLSVILIYSLLMINVEERTFEYGVLRMLGLNLFGLLRMIFMQSLLYSLPGLVVGVAVGELVYLVASIFLRVFLEAPIPYLISWTSLLYAVPLGFLIPVLGSILPIRKAMGEKLNDSLDTKRSRTKAVKVKIERSNEASVPWSLLILSVGATAFGFFIYYFFPLALITMRFSLLLTLFFGLIIMMLIGCVILALNLENIIQRVLTYTLFFWEYSSVKMVVVKNLIAHKPRNRKTTIMYGVSLGFLIFIAVSTRLEIRLYKYREWKMWGSKIVLESKHWRWTSKDLNQQTVMEGIDELVRTESILEGYAYKSVPFSWMAPSTYEDFCIRNVGNYWREAVDVQAISPNFFDVLDDQFLRIYKENKDTGWSLSEQLYTLDGSYRVMLGRAVQKDIGTETLNDNFVFETKEATEMYPKYSYYLKEASAIMEGSAGSTFSKYDIDMVVDDLLSNMFGKDVFVSFPELLHLLADRNVGSYQTIESIPIRYYYLKISDDATDDEFDDLKIKLKDLFALAGRPYIGLIDVEEEVSSIDIVEQVMNTFFYLSTTMAMLMCFFSLISNMYTNVNEQYKEIGVLRSIGCRKFTLKRIYMYEALIIIFTAAIIGICIGSLIGYTLVLQQQLFTQLPLSFIFPWEITVLVFIIGIICGFLSSIFPISHCLRLQPVTILREGY